jgi:4-aminobutyrate aminotransferase
MAAIEFRTTDPLTHTSLSASQISQIPSNIGKKVQQYCLDHDLIILTTSCFDTIRFIPALTVNEEEMDRAIGIFRDALASVAEGEQTKKATKADGSMD